MKRSLLLFLFTALAISAFAQGGQTKSWKVYGSLEGAITFSPDTSGDLGLRQFDQFNRKLRLLNGRIVAVYSNPNSPFGLTLESWFGDTADILYRTEPSDSTLAKYIGQAYVTFADKKGHAIDIGKFTSWIGYESALAADGEVLSRGLLYTVVQPVYHLGLRGTLQLSDKLTSALFVTDGWNQVTRHTGGVTLGAQLKYQATPTTSVTLGYIGGQEGDSIPNRVGSFGGAALSAPGSTDIQLVDLIVGNDPDKRTHFGLNADYGVSKAPNSGRFYGAAAFVRKQVGNEDHVTLRLEWVHDADGVRTGLTTSLRGVTLSYEHPLSPKATVRLEGRIDHSDEPIYDRSGQLSRDQTSLALGLIFRF